MSEVKSYHVTEAGLVEGEALGRINVVLVADHDRVTAERDALQQRLTATDDRADLLEGLLRNVRNKLSFGPEDTKAIDAALRKADAPKDEHICAACGSRGWTANCAECVPY